MQHPHPTTAHETRRSCTSCGRLVAEDLGCEPCAAKAGVALAFVLGLLYLTPWVMA